MKNFDSVEFSNFVKNQKEQMVHITSNSQAKNVVFQVIKDNDYDLLEVCTYLTNLWEGEYPYFKERFNKYDWTKAFNHYIKQAEAEYDWELAKRFKEALDSVSGKDKEANDLLRKQFFNVIEEQGMNPKLMEMDMCLDFWGWTKTLDLLIYGADCESIKESVYETLSPKKEKKEKVKKPIPTTPKASTEVVVEKKIGKTRKRPKYLEIQQWSLEGELIKSWKSIGEASKTLGLNHASISKCLSGAYKKAEGYVWKGITDPKELSTTIEVLPAAA